MKKLLIILLAVFVVPPFVFGGGPLNPVPWWVLQYRGFIVGVQCSDHPSGSTEWNLCATRIVVAHGWTPLS